MRRDVIIIFIIFLLAFFLRLFILVNSDNFQGGIPMQNVLRAIEIKDDNFAAEHMVYNGMLFHYLAATLLYVYDNPVIILRVMCLLFGSMLIFPYFLFLRTVTDKEIAVFSSVLLAVYPHHIIQSTLSMAEIPFHFFLVSSFFLFFYFKKQTKKNIFFLILSALLLSCACMIRYEGWIFIPLFVPLLFRERFRYSILFFLISMLGPLLMMYVHWTIEHDPLFFLHVSDRVSHAEIIKLRIEGDGMAAHYASLFNKILSWPRILVKNVSPFGVALGFFGVIYSLIKRQYLYILLLFLSLFSIFTYKVLNETIFVQTRYGLTLGLLLIPFTVIGIKTLAGSFKKAWKTRLVIFSIVLLSMISIKDTMALKPTAPMFVKDLSRWLKIHTKAEDDVLLDADKWQLYSYNIIVYSHRKLDNTTIVPLRFTDDKIIVDTDRLFEYFNNKKPRFLVYAFEGYLKDIFDFSDSFEIEERAGFMFEPEYENKAYRVYKVIYH